MYSYQQPIFELCNFNKDLYPKKTNVLTKYPRHQTIQKILILALRVHIYVRVHHRAKVGLWIPSICKRLQEEKSKLQRKKNLYVQPKNKVINKSC